MSCPYGPAICREKWLGLSCKVPDKIGGSPLCYRVNMKIAVVTFDGFNEIDSLVAAHILNRVQKPGWKAEITAPTTSITSMNGVVMLAQQPLEFVNDADAVLFGSGRKTRQA